MPSSLRCCACSRHLHAPRPAPAPSPTLHLASSPRRPPTSFEIEARPLAPGRRAAAHPHHAPHQRPLSTCARPATPCSPFPLPTSAASSTSTSTSTSTLRALSTTAAARAAVVDNNPFPFPRAKDASPFDIFHFRRDQVLTAKDVKSRYLQLVKIYHPDRRAAAAASTSASTSKKGKHKAAPDADHEFKAIVAAYELLSSPSRRETYLRTGLGWGSTASYRGGRSSSAPSPSSPWSQSTAEYHFRRGRPMSHGRWAGQYDHWSWSQTWSDPHSPHFRPEDEAARRSGGMSSGGAGGSAGTTAPGWEGQGLFARNGVVFLVLAALTLTVTPLTAWSVVPSAPKGVDPFAPGSDGVRMSELAAQGALEGGSSAWMPRVYDKRHQDAAANLQRARLEARERGHEKRDAIKRRVEELRRVQAFDRARDVQAVEQGQSGTGHLALPPPPVPAGSAAGE
ncbi:hypothetical protein JCM9279_001339 [Rhodotorula babjevae]